MKHVLGLFVVCLMARDIADGKQLAFCTDSTLAECNAVIGDMRESSSGADYTFEGCQEGTIPSANAVEDTTGEIKTISG